MIETASALTELMFAFLGLLTVIGFFAFRGAEERRALLAIAVAAYVIKAILIPAYYWLLTDIGAQGFTYLDSRNYHVSATEMATELRHRMPHMSPGWNYKDPGYNFICAILYTIFGASTIIARLFNAVISSITLLYVYRIALISFNRPVAKIAVRIAAFLPYTILILIDHRKEALVILIATLLFYHALKILTQQKNWATSLLLIVAWLIPMYFIRGGFVLVFCALLLVMFLLTQRSTMLGGALSAIVIAGVIAVQVLLPESRDVNIQENVSGLGERLDSIAHRAQFETGLVRFVKVGSPLDIWKMPFAAFVLLISPFPPRLQNFPIYVYLQDVAQLAFIILLPQFFMGVRECFTPDAWKRRIPLLIYAGGFLSLVGALSSGIIRYRETVFPVVFVLTAAGLTVRRSMPVTASTYGGLLALAAAIYIHRYFL